MAITFSHLLEMLSFHTASGEKIECYHCGERMKEKKALYIHFNGQQRPVCCHGCQAILMTIERNKMVSEYLHARSTQMEAQ